MHRNHGVWIVGVALVLILAPSAATAGEKHTGKGHHVFGYEVEVLDIGNGNQVQHLKNRGFLTYNDESHPLHLASQNCWGTYVGNQEEGNQAGYCLSVPTDRSGAVFFSFTGGPSGGEWHVLRGTGSFEGVTGKGTWMPAGPGWEPDSKGINVVDGTLEMP